MDEMTNRMEKLPTDTYHTWKCDMRWTLAGKDLWEITEGSKVLNPRATEQKKIDFKRRDQKALALICLSIEKSQKIYVRSAKTAKEAWEALSNHFEEKTLSKKILTRSKLYKASLEKGKSMVDHINEVKEIA